MVVTVNDPAGTPANRKVALSNLGQAISPAWITWSPTLANLSGGTLNFARYIKIGKNVHFKFKYTLGGAGVGTGPTFTPPLTPHADELPSSGYNQIGLAALLDDGTLNYIGSVAFTSTSPVNILSWNAGGAYSSLAALSSTIPFTWASGDIIFAQGSYEEA